MSHVNRGRAVAAAILSTLVLAAPASATVVNGSFEADALAPNSLCISYAAPLCPSLTAWSGEIYLVRGQTVFLASPQPYPDGQQIAMLQATNSFRQSVAIATPGTYELTWWDAGRGGFGGNQTYEVSFGGAVLGSFTTSTGSAWGQRSVVFNATAGTFTLEIAGKVPSSQGDHSALLDRFELAPLAVAEPGLLAGAGLALVGAARRRRLRRV